MSTHPTLALLGCGQIGGSLALALKAAGDPITIVGYDALDAHADALRREGGIDHIAASAAEAALGADIVLFAMPLSHYAATARAIAPVLAPHAIVTDAGSVKDPMLAVGTLLPSGIALVPGHPISGSERTGPDAARADLFKDKLCVLTPEDSTDARAVAIVRALWEAAGAIVREMPAGVHDQLYAYVSHLPHVIAFAAARVFHTLGVSIGEDDEMLARFLRISRSNPRMWADIFIENRDALLQGLSMYLAVLHHMAEELRSGEAGQDAGRVAVAKAALPQVFASALISVVSLYEQQSGLNVRAFGAGGLRDIAAPAGVAPEEVTAYISQHAGVVAGLLDDAQDVLVRLLQVIEAADSQTLLLLLDAMQAEAVAINTRRQ